MRISRLLITLLCIPGMVFSAEVLEPYPANPWYWSYGGNPILLRGASDQDNLFQWTGEVLTDHLDLLVSSGGNYVRNTMSDRDDDNIQAFGKLDDGKFDLDQWDEAYWDQLEFFLQQTSRRGIIVQLTLWDVFDRDHASDVFAANNNINYSDEVINGHEEFYATVASGNEIGLRYQRRFVDRLLSATLTYDHVLYNVDNESSGGDTWENYWAAYIHEAAGKLGRDVYVTSMQFDPSNSVRTALTHPELFGFVEISQNNQDSRGARGPAHWENIMFWRQLILSGRGPVPMNNVKVYGAGTGENFSAGTEAEAVNRFWRNIFGGCASSRFHRPTNASWGIGLDERAQANLKAMDKFLAEFDIFSASPNSRVLRHVVAASPGAMEAYALADIGKAYAVYFPRGRYAVGFDPWVYTDAVSVKWLNIETLEWTEAETVQLELKGGRSDWGDRAEIILKTPGNGSYVALVEIVNTD